MLDIQFIRDHCDELKKAARDKNVEVDIDKLIDLDKKRRELQASIDSLRERRNVISEGLQDSSKRTPELMNEGRDIKEKLRALEEEDRLLQKDFKELMYRVPMIPSSDTPVGKDDSENVEVARHGTPPEFSFEVRDHIKLGEILDILDLERGAKIGGYRGYFLKNAGVLLHMGLLMFALKKLVAKGFTPMIPPTLVKNFVLYGSGHFPFDKENIYQVANPGKLPDGEAEDGLYLVGTAEPSLLAYFAGENIPYEKLPVKVCGFSQCYRSEIGSYGKDTRGIYRVHEFMKIEQVIIGEADIEKSLGYLEELRGISEEILMELELPYRVIQICTGDMGAGKYKMYDIETWMPSRKSYGETHSDSNLLDWQSRRLNIKYTGQDGAKKHPYMLNNTALASPRLMIAVLENNQQSDGSVKVPKVLQDYVGMEIIAPNNK